MMQESKTDLDISINVLCNSFNCSYVQVLHFVMQCWTATTTYNSPLHVQLGNILSIKHAKLQFNFNICLCLACKQVLVLIFLIHRSAGDSIV